MTEYKLNRPAKIFLAAFMTLTTLNLVAHFDKKSQTELEAQALCFILRRNLGDKDVGVVLQDGRREQRRTTVNRICERFN